MPPQSTPDPTAVPAPGATTPVTPPPVTPATAPAPPPAPPVTPAVETPVVPPAQPPEGPTDLEKLSDEDLEKQLHAGFRDEAPTPAPPKKEDTPAATPPATPGQPASPAAPATPPGPAPETPPEKLLAGKYKTEGDLEKGVQELAKKLGLAPAVVQVQIDAAKEAKNYAVVEKLYKAMESELGKRPPSTPAAPAVPAPAVPAQPAATPAEEQQFLQAVVDATFERVASSQVVADLRARGLDMPKTQEELAELRKADPAGYMEFRQEFQRIYSEYLQEGREYQKAVTGVEAANTQTTEAEVARIRSFAEANGLKLTDDELKAVTEEAAKSPVLFEDRHGVQYLRPDGIFKWWLAEKFPGRLEEMKTALAARARLEAVEDLKKLQTQTPNTISTTPVPGARTEAPKPDLSKPEDVQRMSGDDLDAAIKRALSGGS